MDPLLPHKDCQTGQVSAPRPNCMKWCFSILHFDELVPELMKLFHHTTGEKGKGKGNEKYYMYGQEKLSK